MARNLPVRRLSRFMPSQRSRKEERRLRYRCWACARSSVCQEARVDVDNLLLSQPDYGEQALQIAEELARQEQLDWLWSILSLHWFPKLKWKVICEIPIWIAGEDDVQGLRKLSSVLAKSWTTCVFINQIRMKIGIMFGNPETTPGGNALKFFASQRIEIRKGEKIMNEKEQIGYLAKIKIAKIRSLRHSRLLSSLWNGRWGMIKWRIS